jgi:hypothetical protein
VTDIVGWLLAGFVLPIGFVFWSWVLLKVLRLQVTKTVDDAIEKVLK